MGTKICYDLPKIWMVLWKIWLYFKRVPSLISRVLECKFVRWMALIKGKAWLVVVKDPVNSGRTYQYNSWKSIISRTLSTSK